MLYMDLLGLYESEVDIILTGPYITYWQNKKSLIFILHDFQYYYLNIMKFWNFMKTEISEIFWKFWNLMKVLKSYENFEFFEIFWNFWNFETFFKFFLKFWTLNFRINFLFLMKFYEIFEYW